VAECHRKNARLHSKSTGQKNLLCSHLQLNRTCYRTHRRIVMARERIHHATDNRAIAGMVIYPDSVKKFTISNASHFDTRVSIGVGTQSTYGQGMGRGWPCFQQR
jgi:hypothetical protein